MERRKFIAKAGYLTLGLMFLDLACQREESKKTVVQARFQGSDLLQGFPVYGIFSDQKVYRVDGFNGVRGLNERMVTYDASKSEATFILKFADSNLMNKIVQPTNDLIYLINADSTVSVDTLIKIYGSDSSDKTVLAGEIIVDKSNNQVRTVFRNVEQNGEYILLFRDKFFGLSQSDSPGIVEVPAYKFIAPRYD